MTTRTPISDRPLVSVVIPTYRRPGPTVRAVESVLAQTWERLEVVVVDDASGDDTREAVAAVDDPRVRLIVHDENRGASAARNTGIEAGSGELVAFLDSDDEWVPRKLEAQVRALREAPPHTALVYCGVTFVREDGGERDRRAHPPGDVRRVLLRRNPIPTVAAVVRRDVLEEVGGFDTSLPSSQDHDLWLRITERYGAAAVDEPLVRIHVAAGAGRISADATAKREGTRSILEKHGAAMREAGVEHLYLRNQGRFFASWACGDVDGARHWYRMSLRARPTSLPTWAWFAASFLPRWAYRGLGRLAGR